MMLRTWRQARLALWQALQSRALALHDLARDRATALRRQLGWLA